MKNSGCIVLLALCLSGCHDEAPTGKSGDFFPLESGKEWIYQRWIDNDSERFDDERSAFGKSKLRVDADLTIEGKDYKRIIDSLGNVDKIVRKEGFQYFGIQHELYGDSFEYVFLDTSKDPGESWSYLKDDGATKTEYVIASKDDKLTLFGKEFENVIQVKVNYYNRLENGDYELWVTAWHYYAEGIGEVYYYYPYPVSNVFGNITGVVEN